MIHELERCFGRCLASLSVWTPLLPCVGGMGKRVLGKWWPAGWDVRGDRSRRCYYKAELLGLPCARSVLSMAVVTLFSGRAL